MPHSELVAEATPNGQVKWWNSKTGTFHGIHTVLPQPANHLAYSSTPVTYITSSGNGKVFIRSSRWRPIKYRQLDLRRILVRDLAVSDDARWIALAYGDANVICRDLDPFYPTHTLLGSTNNVTCVHYKLTAIYQVVAADKSGYLMAWSFSTSKIPAKTLRPTNQPITQLVSARDDLWGVVAKDGKAFLCDLLAGRSFEILADCGIHIRTFLFLSDQDVFVVGKDGLAAIYALGENKTIWKGHLHDSQIRCATAVPGTSQVVTLDRYGGATCFNTEKLEIIWQTKVKSVVNDVVVSPDADWFITCDRGGRLIRRNIADGTTERLLADTNAPVRSICLSPDGNTLASVSTSGFVNLWDPFSGHKRMEIDTRAFEPNAVTFSTDGKSLIAGCTPPAVRVWVIDE